MKSILFVLAPTIGIVLAESVVQPANFFTSNEGALYQGFGSRNLASQGFFTATFQPFDASLGTLTAFKLECRIEGTLAGTIGENAAAGSVAGSLGGAFYLNGIAFDGTSGGNGNGGVAGAPVEAGFAIPAYSREFPIEQAGRSYDPRIVEAIKGDQPYPLAFNTDVKVDYSNIRDLAASVNGTISMSYIFQTAAGSESLRITNLIRNGAQQTVTIEWTSAAGETYAIDASDTLGGWETIATAIQAISATTTFTEQNVPATVTRRFYRVREEE